MMILPPVIGIAGAKGSGKDTLGAFFVRTHFYEHRSFAGPLKTMALAIDPIVDVGFDSRTTYRLSEVVREEGGWEGAKEIPEVRRFLQRLGTEGVRGTFGPDAWVNLAFPVSRRTVFTDVRFPSEAEAVRTLGGGIVIRVVRPGFDGDGHESERALDDVELPVVVNDGTIGELYARGEKLARLMA